MEKWFANFIPASIEARMVKVALRSEGNFVLLIPHSFLFGGRSRNLDEKSFYRVPLYFCPSSVFPITRL